jgi:ubiquitin-hydrolase Zn-finger-containing protein
VATMGEPSAAEPPCDHIRHARVSRRVINAVQRPKSWACLQCCSTDSLWLCLSCGEAHCSSGRVDHCSDHSRSHGGALCLNPNEMVVRCTRCDVDFRVHESIGGSLGTLVAKTMGVFGAIGRARRTRSGTVYAHIGVRPQAQAKESSHVPAVRPADMEYTADVFWEVYLLRRVLRSWRGAVVAKVAVGVTAKGAIPRVVVPGRYVPVVEPSPPQSPAIGKEVAYVGEIGLRNLGPHSCLYTQFSPVRSRYAVTTGSFRMPVVSSPV